MSDETNFKVKSSKSSSGDTDDTSLGTPTSPTGPSFSYGPSTFHQFSDDEDSAPIFEAQAAGPSPATTRSQQPALAMSTKIQALSIPSMAMLTQRSLETIGENGGEDERNKNVPTTSSALVTKSTNQWISEEKKAKRVLDWAKEQRQLPEGEEADLDAEEMEERGAAAGVGDHVAPPSVGTSILGDSKEAGDPELDELNIHPMTLRPIPKQRKHHCFIDKRGFAREWNRFVRSINPNMKLSGGALKKLRNRVERDALTMFHNLPQELPMLYKMETDAVGVEEGGLWGEEVGHGGVNRGDGEGQEGEAEGVEGMEGGRHDQGQGGQNDDIVDEME